MDETLLDVELDNPELGEDDLRKDVNRNSRKRQINYRFLDNLRAG